VFSWFQVDPNEPMPRSRIPLWIALFATLFLVLFMLVIVDWALSLR
jgi:hypothetical protein